MLTGDESSYSPNWVSKIVCTQRGKVFSRQTTGSQPVLGMGRYWAYLSCYLPSPILEAYIVVLSSGHYRLLHCEIHCLALDGFDLNIVHKLSSKVEKSRRNQGCCVGSKKSSSSVQRSHDLNLNFRLSEGVQTISRSVSSHATIPSASFHPASTTNLQHDNDEFGGRCRSDADADANVDAADRRKTSWSKVVNFFRSNVPIWKLRRSNYENVAGAQSG